MNDRTKKGGAVNAHLLFNTDNIFGIPDLPRPVLVEQPKWLAPYRTRISPKAKPTDGAVHFFLDDFRFESVWNKPKNSLQVIGKSQTTLTPDFSLYRDWPIAIQLWNTYRSRWVGCFWASYGYTVIPTISWSTVDSYDFAFMGVAIGSVVAISVCGVNHVNNLLEYDLFMAGYKAMVQAIQPTAVLCYGTPPAKCAQYAEVWVYPTQWSNIRAMRKMSVQQLQAHDPFIEEASSKLHLERYQLQPHSTRNSPHGW